MFDFVRTYCLNKKYTTEEFPFDEKTIVFKVGGKMFCLGDIKNFDSINLKCDPNRAIELRAEYPQITPGYHMSKLHWNTVQFDLLPQNFIMELIDHSYNLVYSSLTKKIRIELENEK